MPGPWLAHRFMEMISERSPEPSTHMVQQIIREHTRNILSDLTVNFKVERALEISSWEEGKNTEQTKVKKKQQTERAK